MKAVFSFAVAATVLLGAVPASAQFAKPEDAIKYRQSALFVMGQHFGRLGAMANGRTPFDAKAAKDAGRPEAELAPVQALQRRAQFMLDFIEAENSMGFHADQEAARVLAKSIDYARRGQMALRGQNPPPVTNPGRATPAPAASASRR